MLDWLKQKLIGSEGWRLWWWQWCIWSEIGWSYWPPASAKGTKLAEIKSAFSADSAVSARERLNICLLPPSDNTNSCFSSIDLPNSCIFDCGKKTFPVHPIFGHSCCWTIFWMILNSWLCQWALADSASDVLLLHKWGNYIWHATLMLDSTSTIRFTPISLNSLNSQILFSGFIFWVSSKEPER